MSLEEKTSLEIEPYSNEDRANNLREEIYERIGKTYITRFPSSIEPDLIYESLKDESGTHRHEYGYTRLVHTKEMKTDKGIVVYEVVVHEEIKTEPYSKPNFLEPYVNVPGYVLSKKQEGNSTVYRVLPIPEKDRSGIEELIREREPKIGNKSFVNFWDRD